VTEAQAIVPANDRGFMYGDGLFETMRVCRGRPFRLAQHLDRMLQGAAFLKITCPYTPQELQDFAGQLIKKNQMPDAILRLVLTRGPGERGYTPRPGGKPTVVMSLHAAPRLDVENPMRWKLITSSIRIPAGDPMASFKTINKLAHVLARLEVVAQGADEALLLNTDGNVAEAAGGNIFWISRGRVCTAPAGCGALPGVTRAVVLELCRKLGLRTSERVIKPGVLRRSAGIFTTQSGFGIVPVVAFDGKPVAPSPLVDQLQRAYCKMLIRS